jgi:hypothetical protein
MNIPHIKLSAIIFILFIFNAQAHADLSDDFCKNKKYLKCLNSTTTKCMTANSQSKIICLKKHPITADEDTGRGFAIAKKYGECAISEYIKALNVNTGKFESCSIHLEPLFEKYLKEKMEQLKVSKERFHEQ